MSKKAVFAVCLSAVAFLSGGIGFWYAASASTGQGDWAEHGVEDSAKYKDLLSELRSTKRMLASAERENASLGTAKKGLELELSELQKRRAGDAAVPEIPSAAQGPSESGLSWAELSSLISGSLEALGKLARNEPLDPEEQSNYDLLTGELLKLSSKAKLLSKDPLLDEPIFRELVSALFGGPLSLSEMQVEKLGALMDSIFEGLPESLEGMHSLDRYQLRQQIVSRLYRGVEGFLEDRQKQNWEGVRNFARSAFTYGGELTLGTSAHARSLMVNWWSNALGTRVNDEALQAAVPAAEAYLERAKAVLSRYAESSEALKGLSPEARAALDGEYFNLQKAFYDEVSPQLSDELREKLRENEPLIIRFEFGQGTSVVGRRRFF